MIDEFVKYCEKDLNFYLRKKIEILKVVFVFKYLICINIYMYINIFI